MSILSLIQKKRSLNDINVVEPPAKRAKIERTARNVEQLRENLTPSPSILTLTLMDTQSNATSDKEKSEKYVAAECEEGIKAFNAGKLSPEGIEFLGKVLKMRSEPSSDFGAKMVSHIVNCAECRSSKLSLPRKT